MPPEEVCAAFNLPANRRTRPIGVAPAQPFDRTKGQLRRTVVGSIAAVVLCLMVLFALAKPGQVVLDQRGITSDRYLSEAGFLSRPFAIPEGTHICKLNVTSTGLNNSWVAVSVAFLDEDENVLLDADATVEYYHGVEGGERWSEGSQKDSTLVKLKGPQKYRINIFGDAGTWRSSYGARASTSKATLGLRLERGVIPARYFLIGFVVVAVYPVFQIGRQVFFEAQRWPSEDDD